MKYENTPITPPIAVVQDMADFNIIFIHSSLDEANLLPTEFRVYAHFARRINSQRLAYPGVDSIAAICRMHRETVMAAIHELERRGMIEVRRKAGTRSVYYLPLPPNWKPVGHTDRSEMVNGQPVGNGERTSRKWGTLPVGNGERKVIHVSKSNKSDPVEKENFVVDGGEKKEKKPKCCEGDGWRKEGNCWIATTTRGLRTKGSRW